MSKKSRLIIESRYEDYLTERKRSSKDPKEIYRKKIKKLRGLKKYDNLDKTEFYRLHILNEENCVITADTLNKIFQKYGLDHEVQNLHLFQKAFISEAYLESNILNNDYLIKIKDVPCVKNFKKGMPLIKHIPIVVKEKKRKVIKRIANIMFDENIHTPATEQQIEKYYNYPMESLSYERLEYLGDAALHQALSKYIYLRYPEKNEGFMSKLRKGIENGKAQCAFFKKMKLCRYMIIPRYMELNGARIKHQKEMENMFEAFMGALFQETTQEEFYTFVTNFIEAEVDFTSIIGVSTNYRGDLNKICNGQNPKWTVENIEETEKNINNNGFHGKVIVRNSEGKVLHVGYGIGKSKTESFVEGAKSILAQMGKIVNLFDDDDNDVYGSASDTDSNSETESGNEEDDTDDGNNDDDVYGSASDSTGNSDDEDSD